MATKTTITMTDDLDGSQADETIVFALAGKVHEIDLSAANAGKLRAALAPYIEAARPVSRKKPGRRVASGGATVTDIASRRPAAARNSEAAQKREWLAANGHPDVAGKRGRFTAEQEHAWANRAAVTPAEPVAAVSEPVSAPQGAPEAKAPRKRGGKAAAPVVEAAAPGGQSIKLTGLSGAQVAAIRDHVEGYVSGTATTAVIEGDADAITKAIEAAREKLAAKGRPTLGARRALAFVITKLTDPAHATAV